MKNMAFKTSEWVLGGTLNVTKVKADNQEGCAPVCRLEERGGSNNNPYSKQLRVT